MFEIMACGRPIAGSVRGEAAAILNESGAAAVVEPEAVEELARVIEELSPDTIYTHSGHDLNEDHRNVHHATTVAAQRVPRLFCYQSPSSTVEFHPIRFCPVDEFMDRKLAVIRSYTSQVKQRRYLDAELLRATSRYWSRYGHSRFVEPFEVARDLEGEATLESAESQEGTMGALMAGAD